MAKVPLTKSQNMLVNIVLQRHNQELLELANVCAEELGVVDSQTTLQDFVQHRGFNVPDAAPADKPAEN